MTSWQTQGQQEEESSGRGLWEIFSVLTALPGSSLDCIPHPAQEPSRHLRWLTSFLVFCDYFITEFTRQVATDIQTDKIES